MARSKSSKFKGKNVNIVVAELQVDEEVLLNSMKNIGDKVATIVKSKAPGSGDYAKGIKAEVDIEKGTYVLKVRAEKYQLSHLLEFGHISSNQYGVYGKVRGRPHFSNGQRFLKKEIAKTLAEEDIIF